MQLLWYQLFLNDVPLLPSHSMPLSLPESAFEKDKLKQERDNLVFKAGFYQKSIDKDTARKGRLIDERNMREDRHVNNKRRIN